MRLRLSLGSRAALPALLVATAVALGFSLPDASAAPSAPRSFAVASESPGATREASRVLTAGGNAFDAMVTATLVSGFTNPASSGLGGGGFVTLYSARDDKALVLDFRETAPAAVDAVVLDKRPLAEEKRGQSVGVPGEVSGLFELHQRYGRTPWQDLVTRAARVAEQGFAIEPHTESQLEEQKASPIARSPAFRATYFPGKAPAKAGSNVRALKLAATLRAIATQGKRGFYEGRIAKDVVAAVAAAGGSMTLADLSQYKTVERQPLRVSWDGREIVTMPAPSAGGLLIAQTLALFSRPELNALKQTPGKRLHLLAEAMRGSFADRMRHVTDPDHSPVDLMKLLAPERMQRRKSLLSPDRTHTQPRYGLEEHGTHQLITADGEGNWVALVSTVNGPFGAKIVGEHSGVILNNELEDFTPSANLAAFEMSENPNRVRPGARPVSSMAPTLVLEGGRPVLALGGSGGTTIAPNVAQVALTLLTEDTSAIEAVKAPRFSIPPPRSGQTVSLEAALAASHAKDLEARGEIVLVRDWKNAVQVVSRRRGIFEAAADPRKQGAAQVSNGEAQ